MVTGIGLRSPLGHTLPDLRAGLLAGRSGVRTMPDWAALQGLRTRADWDPEIQKAIGYLPEAQALENDAHKVLAEKAVARNTAQ